MTHAQLQRLCESPALVQTQDELDSILAHIKICEDCERLARRSIAFDEEFFAPLRAVSGRHLKWWEMLRLKFAGFRRGSSTLSSREAWHAQTCEICSAKFERFSRVPVPAWRPIPVLASFLVLCFAGVAIWKALLPHEPATFRAPLQLRLQDPPDGAKINGWQEFRWSAPGSLSEFTLIIKDIEEDKLVVEKRTDRAFYSFTSNELQRFVLGKRYEWWIRAQIDRKWVESEHWKFIFEEDQVRYTIPERERREFEKREHGESKAEMEAALRQLRKQLLRSDTNSPADLAWIHQSIGTLLIKLEDEKGAAVELRLSVKGWQRLALPDSYEYTRALINLGFAAEDTGALEEALVAYQTADGITRKNTSDDFRKLRSTCLLNLGTLERELGDYDRARSDYNEALQIDEQLYQEKKLPDRTRQADELHNLGNLYVDEYGDPKTGYEKLRQALDFQQQASQQPAQPDLWDSLATAYAAKGDLQNAVEAYKKAIAMSQSQGDWNGEVQSLNNLAGTFIDSRKVPLARGCALKANAITRQAKAGSVSPDNSWTTKALLGKIYLEEGKYREAERLLRSSIVEVNHLKEVLPPRDWYRFRGARQQPVFDLIILLIQQGRLETAFQQLQEFKSESFSVTVELRPVVPTFDDHTVGLDYVIGLPSDPVVVFAKTAKGLEAFRLAPRMKIEGLIGSTVTKLQESGEADNDLKSLAQFLLPPFVRDGILSGRFRHLVISPDGSTQHVPFSALVVGQSDDTKIVKYADVSIVPSLKWWLLARSQFPHRMEQRNDAAVATVDYSRCRANDGLAPLPGAATEGTAVMSYASHGSATFNGLDLKSMKLGDFKVLHFAGHAESTHSLETTRLLLGCNSPQDDLTGTQISKLKLNHSLVVLDACESGAGRIVPGEGVESIAQSFLLAGAACVISTRTVIRDIPAVDLNRRFYSELYGSASISTALQHAEEQASGRTSTLEWSAFTAYGFCDGTVEITPNRWEKLKYSILGHL